MLTKYSFASLTSLWFIQVLLRCLSLFWRQSCGAPGLEARNPQNEPSPLPSTTTRFPLLTRGILKPQRTLFSHANCRQKTGSPAHQFPRELQHLWVTWMSRGWVPGLFGMGDMNQTGQISARSAPTPQTTPALLEGLGRDNFTACPWKLGQHPAGLWPLQDPASQHPHPKFHLQTVRDASPSLPPGARCPSRC